MSSDKLLIFPNDTCQFDFKHFGIGPQLVVYLAANINESCASKTGHCHTKRRVVDTLPIHPYNAYLRGIMPETQVGCETTMWHFFETRMVWDRYYIMNWKLVDS